MTIDPIAQERRAKAGFMLIALNRLIGILMIGGAILSFKGVFPLPNWASLVLLAAGMIDFFVVPQILARSYRTPKT